MIPSGPHGTVIGAPHEGPSGPRLDLPIVYDFATARPPYDHVITHQVITIPIPEDGFVRGVEVGLGPLRGMLSVHIEWSEPARRRPRGRTVEL